MSVEHRASQLHRARVWPWLVAVTIEAGLFTLYQLEGARYHWFVHFFVGASVALAVMTAWSWRTRRPVAHPLAWVVAAHIYAMFPDLLFDGVGIAHHRWMNVFLGHLWVHFIPGQDLTWYGVFVVALSAYLLWLDHLRSVQTYPPTLKVEQWGQGPPVVFLHGLGASSRYWGTLARTSGGYRGIAPDLLGFGRSPKPPWASYDATCHIESLDPLVPQGAVVVGHSTGAILAAALAESFPGRVRALVLIGLPGFADADEARQAVSRLGLLARLTVKASPLGWAACHLAHVLGPLVVPLAPLVVPELPSEVASDYLRHTWLSYSRTLKEVVIAQRAVDEMVLAARCPVVFVHGSADRAAPLAGVRAIVAKLQEIGAPVRLVVSEGGDHQLALRRPDVVAAALSDLLASPGASVEKASEASSGRAPR
ncbi:MAG: alpha/beta fold hydrolase [Acidimicrobiales bacterium]